MKSTGVFILLLTATLPSYAGFLNRDTSTGSTASAVLDKSDGIRGVTVNCTRGQTIGRALEKGKTGEGLEIQFFGTCQEDVLITRNAVTLVGIGTAPTLIGTLDVRGALQVNISNFSIQGVPGAPFNTAEGAINITQGGSANVQNVKIQDVKVRGFQVIGGTASIKDVTISNAQAGAFVFRSAAVSLSGAITTQNSIFGMSVVYSGVFAKTADLTFNKGLFGLIIQVNGSVEHVIGHLTVNDNMVGMLLAGSAVYAYGTFIEARRNSIFGIQLDEESSMTPLIGAPGGGPGLTVTDNAVGISVERQSDLELVQSAVITGNQVGLQVDNSLARLADTAIHDNLDSDVVLSFNGKAEFNGTANIVGHGVKCDSTALTRGSISCSPTASAVSK